MRYLSDVNMAKEIDRLTIEKVGIPSVVLMERAAMAVAACICKNSLPSDRVLVLCGNGNNGADGLAVARMLKEMGHKVYVKLLCGDTGTEEFNTQLKIAENVGVSFINETFCMYEIVVDAIFGIGLSRNIEGEIAKIIEYCNMVKGIMPSKIFAVDVPSGISADGVKISDTVIKADYTITFGTNKLGLVLGNNASYVGEIIVADIGFPKAVMDYVCGEYFYYEESQLEALLPGRRPNTNKGSYGKVVAICGSENMAGAAILCSKALYKAGAGMVKCISHSSNRGIIQTSIPEALYSSYDINMEETLKDGIDFADTIVIGPGLGTSENTTNILEYVVNNSKCNIIVDADGINILARFIKEDSKKADELMKKISDRCIITPHIVEMARFCGKDKDFVKNNIVAVAKEIANRYGIITVLKDSRTVVSDGNKTYINISGNNGMATAGSGDVLAGIIASFVAQGQELLEGACTGCFVHGLAGDDYANRHNRYSLTASDLIDSLENIL